MRKGAKLMPARFAFSIAIFVSVIMFLVTVLALLWHCENVFVLSSVYGGLGYSVSMLGAVVGAVYSFIDAFILMWIFAWVYNKARDCCRKAKK